MKNFKSMFEVTKKGKARSLPKKQREAKLWVKQFQARMRLDNEYAIRLPVEK